MSEDTTRDFVDGWSPVLKGAGEVVEAPSQEDRGTEDESRSVDLYGKMEGARVVPQGKVQGQS